MAEKKKFLVPMGDNVLLKRTDQKKTTEGGILLPDSLDQKTYECEVLDAGPSCDALSAGDIVVIQKTDELVEVALGQQTVILVQEEEILAKVVEK